VQGRRWVVVSSAGICCTAGGQKLDTAVMELLPLSKQLGRMAGSNRTVLSWKGRKSCA
jgi:hypothetical protein